MQVRLWDPWMAVARMDREMDDMVRRTFGRAAESQAAEFLPAVEVVSEGPDVVIRLELPGVDPSAVDVSVHEGRLTVSGERRERREDKQGGVLVRELRYGTFRREFALPDHVSGDDVSASYDAGMLTVRVAGVQKPAVEPKKVQVSIGSGDSPRTVEAESSDQS